MVLVILPQALHLFSGPFTGSGEGWEVIAPSFYMPMPFFKILTTGIMVTASWLPVVWYFWSATVPLVSVEHTVNFTFHGHGKLHRAHKMTWWTGAELNREVDSYWQLLLIHGVTWDTASTTHCRPRPVEILRQSLIGGRLRRHRASDHDGGCKIAVNMDCDNQHFLLHLLVLS